MVTHGFIIVNGVKKPVDLINKGGVTYIKTRDFVRALAGSGVNIDVSSQGSTPVLTID